MKIVWLSLILFMFNLPVQGREMRKNIPFLDRQMEFTHNVARLIEYIYATGCKCTFGETFRTHDQALLYHKLGIGSADSNHCYRLAIDLNIFDEHNTYLHDTKDYLEYGSFWEKLNPFNEWGGRWKRRPDGNHFEMD